MNKKFIVRLSDAARAICPEVIKKLKGSSQQVRRAHLLLKADADGPAWTDRRIAEAFGCRVQTIENLRKRLCPSIEPGLIGPRRLYAAGFCRLGAGRGRSGIRWSSQENTSLCFWPKNRSAAVVPSPRLTR